MKHFMDLEFIEHATGIQIISLGIYSENGNTLYIESSSFDLRLADDWVKENVIKKLEFYHSRTEFRESVSSSGVDLIIMEGFIPEYKIGEVVLDYMKRLSDDSPEFYAYFASYDWVVFCRLFGRMIDLPENFPMWVIDLKQMMWERGLTKEWKQEHHPDPEGEHNALVDAKWNYQLYQKMESIDCLKTVNSTP